MAGSILVPVDFSDVTEAVIAQAQRLAEALGAKIWLIHVASARPDFVGYEVGPVSVRDSVARELHREHEQLQQYQDELRAEGLVATALLVPGMPPNKILEEAERIRPDMIVIGSHGHGALYHLLAGSVCEGVLKHAPCPVVVVPAKPAHAKTTTGQRSAGKPR
jgi:nucleotide-binding universal stress UspA family protein